MVDYNSINDKAYIKAIALYLQSRCQTDTNLAEACKKETKTLAGCLEYVKSEAKKKAENGVAVIPDDEVYQAVVHYILEDSLNFEPKAKAPVPKTDKPAKKKSTSQKDTKPSVSSDKPKNIQEELQLELF